MSKHTYAKPTMVSLSKSKTKNSLEENRRKESQLKARKSS